MIKSGRHWSLVVWGFKILKQNKRATYVFLTGIGIAERSGSLKINLQYFSLQSSIWPSCTSIWVSLENGHQKDSRCSNKWPSIRSVERMRSNNGIQWIPMDFNGFNWTDFELESRKALGMDSESQSEILRTKRVDIPIVYKRSRPIEPLSLFKWCGQKFAEVKWCDDVMWN